MAEQQDLSQFQSNSYTLTGLREELSQARGAELDGVTIVVGFDSPQSFRHEWTFEDITTLEEYKEELEDTRTAAYRRLKNAWWDKHDENLDKVKNEVSLEIKDFPREIDRFKQAKKKEQVLQQAIAKTRQVYNKSGDRSRNISIAQRLDHRSSNLEEYLAGLNAVEENLEFEDNFNVDEEDDVFENNRQRTTGDNTWVNEEGVEVRTLAFSTGVTFQIGGPQGQRIEFDNGREAKTYYKEHRLA